MPTFCLHKTTSIIQLMGTANTAPGTANTALGTANNDKIL